MSQKDRGSKKRQPFISRRKLQALRRQCPACKRKAALEGPIELVDQALDLHVGIAYRCRWCGHECGRANGERFGYQAE
jgi:hypothetical protein